MGNEGRKNITKKFDVEAMCDSNLREYKKLLKKYTNKNISKIFILFLNSYGDQNIKKTSKI